MRMTMDITPMPLSHSPMHMVTCCTRPACSPIVGMYCMSRLAWKTMPGVVLVNYADDFLLLAKSPKLLDKAIGKLTDAMGDLPGGQFILKLKTTSNVDAGFDFLGHTLQAIEDKLVTSPTAGNIDKLFKEVMRIEEALWKKVYAIEKHGVLDNSFAVTPLARMKAKADGWVKAFSQCDDAAGYVEQLTHEFDVWLEKLGLTLKQIVAATDPSMAYDPGDYALGH